MLSRPGEMQVVDSRYVLKRLLGQGGAGRVFEAFDCLAEEVVALKVLNAQTSEESRWRFEREVLVCSEMDHPNIVSFRGFGVDEDFGAFAVMERVDGFTLREALHLGPIALGTSLEVAGQVLEGLAYAHESGLVHHDIKPENLLVSVDQGANRVRIIDFGITKVEGRAFGRRWPSSVVYPDEAGPFFGTPSYAAPEQVNGTRGCPASDVYSLGMTVSEMLLGVLPPPDIPVRAPTVSLGYLRYLLRGGYAEKVVGSLEGVVPPDVSALLFKAMAPDISERFSSAEEMAEAVKSLSDRYPASRLLGAIASPGAGQTTEVQSMHTLMVASRMEGVDIAHTLLREAVEDAVRLSLQGEGPSLRGVASQRSAVARQYLESLELLLKVAFGNWFGLPSGDRVDWMRDEARTDYYVARLFAWIDDGRSPSLEIMGRWLERRDRVGGGGLGSPGRASGLLVCRGAD
jgi:serine/threonine protein kinase